jgi:hypothetical protein
MNQTSGLRVSVPCRVRYAPAQLADDQQGPADLPRPGPLAVDVHDVHGPAPRSGNRVRGTPVRVAGESGRGSVQIVALVAVTRGLSPQSAV